MDDDNMRGESMPGLDITEESFRKLPTKEQNTIIFKNTQDMKQKLDAHLQSYRFHKKVTYTTMGIISGGFLFIIEYLFRNK